MAIAIDTTTNLVADGTAGATSTITHDGGTGSDRVTALFMYTIELDVAATATYNGVSMVEQAKVARAPGTNRFIWLFSKFGTSTGSNSLVASFSPNARSTMGAITLTGASQTDTIDDAQSINQASGTTMVTTGLSPTVAGCVILATSATPSDSDGVTADSNTVQINFNDIIQMIRSVDVPIASAGAYNIGYTYASGAAAIAAGVFAPAATTTFLPRAVMY